MGIALILALLAQTTGVVANPHRTTISVPFIGCALSGQTEVLDAPKGTSISVPISPKDAETLAYYKSADGIGVLAPLGWYCEGASGSGGSALFVGPRPIHNTSSGWEGLKGPAIELTHINGWAPGRYEIAEIIARVFPDYRAFAAGVFEEHDHPLPPGPYPKDTLNYKSKRIVEYETPAQTEWLGISIHG